MTIPVFKDPSEEELDDIVEIDMLIEEVIQDMGVDFMLMLVGNENECDNEDDDDDDNGNGNE
jgi:hypothetical protein